MEQLDAELETSTREEPGSVMEFNMRVCTHILDPEVGTGPISIEEVQNTNVGSIYDKEVSDQLSLISVTDANDSTGNALLRAGWKYFGHGGYGDLIPSSFFLPPPLATPGIYPRYNTLAELSLLRKPSVLILQHILTCSLKTFP